MSKNSPSFLKNLIFAVVVLGAVFFYFRRSGKEIPLIDKPIFGQTDEPDEAVDAEPGTEVYEPEESPEQLAFKLNPYTEAVNYLSGRAFDSYNRYASWVKQMQRGPTGQESTVYGLYTLYDPKTYFEKLDGAQLLDPELPLIQAAADSFRQSYLQLYRLVEDVYRYYDHEDYKDDQWKKGKAVHPELVQAFRNFFRAERALREALRARQAGLLALYQSEALDSVEHPIQYQMYTAQRLANGIMDLALIKDLKELSLQPFSEKLDSLEALVSQIREASEGSEDSYLQSYGKSFADSYDGFLKSAKVMRRRVRDRAPLESHERWMLEYMDESSVEGMPGHLMNAYNQTVGAFNRLDFEGLPEMPELIEQTMFHVHYR
ncbi:MAG: YiiG family protein [Bacteroidia bacterium]|nr:YiiG family protein [Bacteroidia bacterium]